MCLHFFIQNTAQLLINKYKQELLLNKDQVQDLLQQICKNNEKINIFLLQLCINHKKGKPERKDKNSASQRGVNTRTVIAERGRVQQRRVWTLQAKTLPARKKL